MKSCALTACVDGPTGAPRVRVHAGEQTTSHPLDVPSAPEPRVASPAARSRRSASTARPASTRVADSVVATASASTVVTPEISRYPRSTAATAASSPPRASCASSWRSVVHHSRSWSTRSGRGPEHRSPDPDLVRPARPTTVASRRGVGRAPSALSRSWRSSASWASGVISSCTRSIAAGIERSDGRQIDLQPASELHRARAAVLRIVFVVEERVRRGGEDLVREHRRFGGVAAVHGDRARLDAFEQLAHAVDVERLVQRVGDRLADEEVIGDLDRAGDVLLAGRRLGEQRRHHVVGFHALDRWRVLAPVAEPQDEQAPVEVPPPARQEHRRVEDRLAQRVLDRRARDVARHLVEREAVVRAE